jgi:signal transduction histidine kinase
MADVAAGQFVVPDDLPYRRQDEIGDLARSFSWMTEHLARLDKMKAEFISIATHELKTPINVIGGYAELVEEGLYGPVSIDQRNALDAIREQTQVLTRLVNQLLDISRLEAGGLHLQMGIVQVETLLDSLRRSFTILSQQKSLNLRFDVADSVPETIQGDADRLRDQVLGNLLSNSLKFTGENGRVLVRAWGTERALELEVTDSGVGIPKDKVAFIFDKFFQIGEHARSKGAGLGLAIAREVVEAHGGRIWVESEQNVGTTFRISLPVHQPKLRRAAEEPVEAGVGDANG